MANKMDRGLDEIIAETVSTQTVADISRRIADTKNSAAADHVTAAVVVVVAAAVVSATPKITPEMVLER